ncbi:unnamed protein product [Cyprideis torosa]|uniref:Uncharacterized protein n=1 Tax=Cyprideis torosa TaxID=163714 RepID=A0A7R8W1G0_9CRUS|nr:unnamed protein product [Cyprideis torosa]CAG0880692.1 unnamed protein product [Cyprideis torosa]
MAGADSKYANLPGIIHDQPDVYESKDLPEVDQNLTPELKMWSILVRFVVVVKMKFLDVELRYFRTIDWCLLKKFPENPDIERPKISAAESLGHFKAAGTLDASMADFSGKLRSTRGGAGYLVGATEYSYTPPGGREAETPLQKYQRLKMEVLELEQQLRAENFSTEGASELSKNLAELGLEERLEAPLLDAGMSGGKRTSAEQVLNEIGSLKASLQGVAAASSTRSEKSTKKTVPGNSVSYELILDGSLGGRETMEKLLELQSRLNLLEKTVGSANIGGTSLFSCSSGSLWEAADSLSAQVSLLDPGQLDLVEGRLQVLSNRINEFHEKRSLFEDPDKQKKLNELYEICMRNEGLRKSIAGLAQHIRATHAIHAQAQQVCRTFANFDASQEQLRSAVHHNRTLLGKLQKDFNEALEKVQTNITKINEMMDKS